MSRTEELETKKKGAAGVRALRRFMERGDSGGDPGWKQKYFQIEMNCCRDHFKEQPKWEEKHSSHVYFWKLQNL